MESLKEIPPPAAAVLVLSNWLEQLCTFFTHRFGRKLLRQDGSSIQEPREGC